MASLSPARVTARPAEKRTETEKPDPALMRRTVGAIVTATGCRRSEAREQIAAWLSDGRRLDDLACRLAYADPTGETVAREAGRGRTALDLATLRASGGGRGV